MQLLTARTLNLTCNEQWVACHVFAVVDEDEGEGQKVEEQKGEN